MIDRLGFLLFTMAAAHAVCDYSLQPGALSAAKRPGGDACLPWPIALGGHSLIHGGAVALITGLWWLGAAEAAAHAAIDFGSTRGAFGISADQVLHMVCKVAWAAIAVGVANG